MTENEIGTMVMESAIAAHRELGPGLFETVMTGRDHPLCPWPRRIILSASQRLCGRQKKNCSQTIILSISQFASICVIRG
jgi:hypothetical protein